ncbi:MAG: hypothetical protein AABX72_04220 [Nanoarchaeota archaeon]
MKVITNKQKSSASSLWIGVGIGALVMLFLVNLIGNNLFSPVVSKNTCEMMHRSSFLHSPWSFLLILVIAFLIYIMIINGGKRYE